MRALALVLAVIAATGCDGVFGLTGGDHAGDDLPGDASRDDASVDACMGTDAWTSTKHLELGAGLLDPTLTNDQLEVFVVSDGMLQTARRSSVTETFSSLEVVAFPAHGIAGVSDPALTLDGLDMVFAAQSPMAGIYEMRRELGATSWSMPLLLKAGVPSDGLDISPDGLDLYVQTDDQDLYDFHRASLAAPLAVPASLGITASFPSVTETGLRVYYAFDSSIVTATRASIGDSFGNPMAFAIDGGPVMGVDVDASADGGTLIFVTKTATATAVVILTRGCN